MQSTQRLWYLILLFLCFHSCKDVKNNNLTISENVIAISDTTVSTEKADLNDNRVTNNEFLNYLKHFNHKTLPIEMKGCSMDVDDLFEFPQDDLRKFNVNYSYAYCQIPTNGNFIATITLGVADCYLPVLTTYTLNGEIIDEKALAIGYGLVDCGHHTEDYMILKKDYTIYVSDTLKVCECDSSYKIIEETCEQYVIYREGRLLSDGKIELTKTLRKNIRE